MTARAALAVRNAGLVPLLRSKAISRVYYDKAFREAVLGAALTGDWQVVKTFVEQQEG